MLAGGERRHGDLSLLIARRSATRLCVQCDEMLGRARTGLALRCAMRERTVAKAIDRSRAAAWAATAGRSPTTHTRPASASRSRARIGGGSRLTGRPPAATQLRASESAPARTAPTVAGHQPQSGVAARSSADRASVRSQLTSCPTTTSRPSPTKPANELPCNTKAPIKPARKHAAQQHPARAQISAATQTMAGATSPNGAADRRRETSDGKRRRESTCVPSDTAH